MTVATLLLIIPSVVSIHTPIQGVTAHRLDYHTPTPGFNPHTHTGCDGAEHREASPFCVSIHTPIQGVTVLPWRALFLPRVSIHTPIQGVTALASGGDGQWWFQSTHPYRV